MVDNLEKQIYELIRPYAGTYLFTGKEVPLTPETDLDTDLQIDEAEIEDLMDAFFTTFNVDRAGFTIKTYFPDSPFSWNIFKKNGTHSGAGFHYWDVDRLCQSWPLAV